MAVPTPPAVTTQNSVTGLTVSSVNCPAPTGIAVGDLLFAHCGNTGATWSTPSGWTLVAQKSATHICAVFYKVAEVADAAASTFNFAISSGSANLSVKMIRITNQRATSPVTQSNSAEGNGSTVTVTTVTPTYPNSLLLFFVSTNVADDTFSGHAIVTSNPSWSEIYDAFGTTSSALGLATANRPEMTATGNWTATVSTTRDWTGIVVVVAPIPDTTASVSVLSLTSTLSAVTITTNSNVPVSAVPITTAIPAPTLVTQEYPAFSNTSKNTATATNTTKNVATATNTTKHDATVTNTQKTS